MSGAAVVVGAGGGIGRALVEAIREEDGFGTVHALDRAALDLTDEASIEAAAARIAAGPRPTLVIVATGLLHDETHGPEKALAEIDPDWMVRSFAINTIGPALVLKHFLPLLPKGERAVFALLSARVGSIGDNRMGGWHSYRASKAALNMIVKGASVEAARTHPRAIVAGLHPGTVDTRLSRPFQGSVRAGGLFAPGRAAVQLLDVIDGLKVPDTGGVFAWDGSAVPN